MERLGQAYKEAASSEPGPRVPLGRRIMLPGRGQIFVREAGGPLPGAPTVLLVHGWMASAALNWASVYQPLATEFNVIGVDLRGHGRGIRSRHRFRLEDCADDLAALVEQLGCGPVIVVGYSMGGLVAQLMWRRHPDRVAGLILCSTTRSFQMGRRERYLFSALMSYGASSVRVGRGATFWYRAARRVGAVYLRPDRPVTMRRWASAELRRHDMRQVLEAGLATCQFDSRSWLGNVDVPTAVVVTTLDRAIAAAVQLQMAESISSASVYSLPDDHTAFLHPEYPPILLDACRDVASRASRPRTSSY